MTANTVPAYLFVGGSWDGMMIPVADADKRDYIMKPERSYSSITNAPTHFRMQSYKRVTLRDTDGTWVHFFLCGGNVNAPLQELISGYAHNAAFNEN